MANVLENAVVNPVGVEQGNQSFLGEVRKVPRVLCVAGRKVDLEREEVALVAGSN